MTHMNIQVLDGSSPTKNLPMKGRSTKVKTNDIPQFVVVHWWVASHESTVSQECGLLGTVENATIPDDKFLGWVGEHLVWGEDVSFVFFAFLLAGPTSVNIVWEGGATSRFFSSKASKDLQLVRELLEIWSQVQLIARRSVHPGKCSI